VLATLGVVLTTGLTGLAAWWLLDLGTTEAMLIGAIVASTDAAAVFFLLHANGLHLQRRIGSTLEIESGSNDPVAVFLTLTLCGWIASRDSGTPAEFVLLLVQQLGIGALAGVAGGRAIAAALSAQGVEVLDLLPAFAEAGQQTRLYKPRDTHWNLAGNRLAATVIAPAVRARLPHREK
jgi:cell volume regulation protein A